MAEWRDIMHVLGEIGSLGQLGTFGALVAVVLQLRGLKERFDSLATQVEAHASTIIRLEKAIAHLQGWLDGKDEYRGQK